MDEMLEALKNFGDVETGRSFRELTTLKIGGPVDYVVYPHHDIELSELLKYCRRHEIPYKLVGKGSDMLCSDDAYHGIVIRLDRHFHDVIFNGTDMIAQSGASIIAASVMAMKKGLSGLEFASGIPGTVGGCVFMNAGAYKACMADVLSEVFVYHDGMAEWLDMKECCFAYRTSIFQQQPDWVILGAKFHLKEGEPEEIARLMEDRRQRRIRSQPLEYPSCGSVFRNPEGQNAWALIDGIGYRGRMSGDAQVSEKHCNFIINKGQARAEDYLKLVESIQQEVFAKYGIRLETEMEKFNWHE
jgi:UDP-N-acetylmuramate dehydrogenase